MDIEDVEDVELRAWLQAPDLPGDGDPLDAAPARYGDPAGDTQGEDEGDLLDFVAALCGDDMCLGFRTHGPVGKHTQLQVRMAPFRRKGADGLLVIPPEGAARVVLPTQQPVDVAVEVDRRQDEVRVRLPRFQHPDCPDGCELHVGPAEARDPRDQRLLDSVDIYYRVPWPD